MKFVNKLINILASSTGQKQILPFYHAVGNETPLHLKHLYKVRSCARFEADLVFFKANYKSIDSSDLNNGIQKRTFHITFDDGLREFKTQAWPILKKHNIAVSLFINPAFVGNKSLFYRFKTSLLAEHVLDTDKIDFKGLGELVQRELLSKENVVSYLLSVSYEGRAVLDDIASHLNYSFEDYLTKHKPYLDLDELFELQAEGVHLGAHSMDHPLFHKLHCKEQFEQVKESVNWVQGKFGSMRLFSFPFTDYGVGKRLFQSMEKELDIDCSFGTAGMKKEQFSRHLQRIPMENHEWSAQKIILSEYFYYLIKAPLFKNTIKR